MRGGGRHSGKGRGRLAFAMIGALLPLAACDSAPKPVPLTPEQSAALAPRDARIAGLYAQSCRACHTVRDSGAPLTGDRTQWDPRWAKGMPVLVRNAVAGLGRMPAGGQCFACTPQEYEALIRFMAGREQEDGR